jgi:hypothetical protein
VADTPPLSRRMPGFDARHATSRARRTRVVGVCLAVLIVAAALFVFFGRGSSGPAKAPQPKAKPAVSSARVVTTLASWRLGAPISRAVVVPGSNPAGSQVTILGGSTTGALTASGAFVLDTTTGALTQVGDLMTTLDDAAGTVIGGSDDVFGGTSSPTGSPSATVQSLPAAASTNGGGSGTAVPTSTLLGTLPEPRASATAVTSGPVTYLVGGEGTSGPDPDIVATTDGRHFTTVAHLRIPVTFPAVAAVGKKLYVFGGTAATGSNTGSPVDTIQVVNLTTHKVTAALHLAQPLTAAAAVVLGHDILLAGGDTTGTVPTTSTTSTTSTTPGIVSVSTVWLFNPATGSTTTVGHLSVAVSHAGVAVLGTTAWLVGGESDGTPVSSVQSFVTAAPAPASGH